MNVKAKETDRRLTGEEQYDWSELYRMRRQMGKLSLLPRSSERSVYLPDLSRRRWNLHSSRLLPDTTH